MSPLSNHIQRLAVAVLSGKMTLGAFLALVLPMLSIMRGKAAVEADVKLSKKLDATPVGLYLPDMSEYFSKSLTTVMEDVEIAQGEPDKLTRLIESIEFETKQVATTKSMKMHGVKRYRFIAGPDACDKCKADDGKVYPVYRSVKHHNGCNCDAEPLKENSI